MCIRDSSTSTPDDQDNDFMSDAEENIIGTDPNNDDTDNDGIIDGRDSNPLDPGNNSNSDDSDGDGIPDSIDPDDDNDGYSDEVEIGLGTDPNDSNETPSDQDSDFIPDELEEDFNTDPNNPDTDGDGILDGQDDFPTDPDRGIDTDGDGIDDTQDPDDDDDGVLDDDDAFPTNADETSDSDGDGIADPLDLCPNTPEGEVDANGCGLTQKYYDLETSTIGQGSISEKVINSNRSSHLYGTQLMLTANPLPGWKFMSWSGDVESTDNVVVPVETDSINCVFE